MLKFIVRHSPIIIFLLAVVSIIAGVLLREPSRVFDQAIRICLSCIGIG
ncbi:MAG: CD1871A family CXXC motif-containing protein [Proteobacteria bacterium]|nr:CD1871A family CXXC motif-containing protein [Pseudomonadota bacterium]